MKFRESETKIKFINKIESRIEGHDFYGSVRLLSTSLVTDDNETDDNY
jgi:hypothetical protein